jgi:hypothetical protein
MLNRIRSVLLGGGLLAMALAGSGCRQADLTRQHLLRPWRVVPVEIEGPALREQTPTAITVRNERGSVWIEVDEHLSEPVVEAKISWGRDEWMMPWPGNSGGGKVLVTRDTTNGPGDILRIEGVLSEGAPESAFLDLRVRTPRCDGVNVINDGGPIILLGVGGAITAQNGVEGSRGGRIELRTSKPIQDPIALVTIEGRISAVLDPSGRGRVELDAEGGNAEFESSYGSVTEVRPSPNRFRGVWNGGSNPIIARSARGHVHVQVQPNAEMYTVADGWIASVKR